MAEIRTSMNSSCSPMGKSDKHLGDTDSVGGVEVGWRGTITAGDQQILKGCFTVSNFSRQ